MSSLNSLFTFVGDSNWLVPLAEVALKGSVLVAVAAAITLALRKARASLRHLVWSAALAGMIAVPVLSLVLPHWSLPLLPRPASASDSQGNPVARHERQATYLSGSNRSVTDSVAEGISRAVAPQGTAPLVGSANNRAQSVGSSSIASVSPGLLLPLIWLTGILACLLAIATSVAGLRIIARRAKRLSDPSWINLLAALKLELGIDREVVLLRSERTSMPATWGIARPVILLPAEASEWSLELKRVVLLHELAHVKRYDCLTQLLAQLCCAFYWFHPGVWYIARRMRSERELACDELVLGLGINACDYADHLLQIARSFRTPAATSIAAIAMARPSQLEGRLLAIVNGDGQLRQMSVVSRARVVAAMLIVTLPLAAMRPWRGAAVSTPESKPAVSSAERPAEPAPIRLASISAAEDTFRWRGPAAAGQWVEIHANIGEIRAILAPGPDVEVIAVNRSGKPIASTLRLNVDRRRNGVGLCVIPKNPARESCDDAFMKHSSTRSDRVDFLVKVPKGVGFGGHTVTGNVSAEDLQSYAWGTAKRGDISLITTDLAEASTDNGSISAVFGRAHWKENLEFETGNGTVTVVVPSNSNTMFQAETNSGRVVSEFPVSSRRNEKGEHTFGRIGTGGEGGLLTVRSGSGDVTLRRGPVGVVGRDIYADAQSSIVDPKPNPNPDPEVDPNPSPNPNPNPNDDPNPNPYPTPSYRGPNSGDITAPTYDDPTGEKVPLKLPVDFMNRFKDVQIRSAPDRAAIVRLRDIAMVHQKEHPADLVQERALWALSLVNGGLVIQPLIDALSDGDWRVRAYAAWALSESGESRVVPALMRAARDPHWRVRMHAVYGLELGGKNAVTTLIELLQDPYWQVRIGALDALTTIGDDRAIGPLRALQQDRHPLVREEAAAALSKLER